MSSSVAAIQLCLCGQETAKTRQQEKNSNTEAKLAALQIHMCTYLCVRTQPQEATTSATSD